MRAQWSLKPGLCHHPSVCGQWRQRRWPPSRQREIMPRPTGTACRRCPFVAGGRCGRFRRAARLSAWHHLAQIQRPSDGLCSTTILCTWLRCMGTACGNNMSGGTCAGAAAWRGMWAGRRPKNGPWVFFFIYLLAVFRRLPPQRPSDGLKTLQTQNESQLD